MPRPRPPFRTPQALNRILCAACVGLSRSSSRRKLRSIQRAKAEPPLRQPNKQHHPLWPSNNSTPIEVAAMTQQPRTQPRTPIPNCIMRLSSRVIIKNIVWPIELRFALKIANRASGILGIPSLAERSRHPIWKFLSQNASQPTSCSVRSRAHMFTKCHPIMCLAWPAMIPHPSFAKVHKATKINCGTLAASCQFLHTFYWKMRLC